MEYQLILQWSGALLKDYDSMIEIENKLIEGMSDKNEVDGHDVGSDEINIFILTDNPQVAFNEAKTIIERKGLDRNLRAAYRRIKEDHFEILWPSDPVTFSIK